MALPAKNLKRQVGLHKAVPMSLIRIIKDGDPGSRTYQSVCLSIIVDTCNSDYVWVQYNQHF